MPPPTFGRYPALLVDTLLFLALAGCGGRPDQTTSWNGRRDYDGNGDCGDDPDAPREAAVF